MWNSLPNIDYINRIIASMKKRPDVWAAHFGNTDAFDGLIGSIDDDDLPREEYREWQEHRNRCMVQPSPITVETIDVAFDAILVLILFPESAYMIDSDVGELKILVALGDYRATLLLPACIALKESK